jgi:murein L,D-transpeptidase YcbB/YkuD
MAFSAFPRIRASMIRSLVLLASALSLATPLAAQEPLRIDLNIPALKLVVYEGDEEVETYPIAVGMPGFDTPTGSFAITHAEWNPWWHPPTHREWAREDKITPPGPNNPMGRVKLFFLPLYFIHGTPAGESIGTPASHGCVRMRNEDVVELALLLHERAAPHVSEDELERIIDRPSDTRRINFREEIEVVIRYDAVAVEDDEIFVYPDIYNRNAVHTESVYQALISAGYDVSNVDFADVRRLVDSARGQKVPVVVEIDDAFRGRVALARD